MFEYGPQSLLDKILGRQAMKPAAPGGYIYGTSPEGDANWRKQEQEGWQAEHDLNTLPTTPDKFDESAFGQSYNGPMTNEFTSIHGSGSMLPKDRWSGYSNSNDGDIDQPGEEGTSIDNAKEAPSIPDAVRGLAAPGPYVSPNDTPQNKAIDYSNHLASQARLRQMDAAKNSALADRARRFDLANPSRGAASDIPVEFAPSGRNGGGVERVMPPAKPLRGLEDTLASLGIGDTGVYKENGNVSYVKNDRVPNTNKYTSEDDGLPGGKVPFGPVLSRGNSLTDSMNRYSDARAIQRGTLEARYPNDPNKVSALMGENQNGRTDISRLRAMAGTLQREGLSPEQAMAGATVLGQERGDPATAEQRASAKALYETLLKGPEDQTNSIRDQMALIAARASELNSQIALNKDKREGELHSIALENERNPSGAIQRKIDAENTASELDARGKLKKPTIDAYAETDVQRVLGNDYVAGKPLDPQLGDKLWKEYTDDSYDNGGTNDWWNLGGVLGGGGWTDSQDEDIFVKYLEKKYPGFPEAAARKLYKERKGGAQPANAAGWLLTNPVTAPLGGSILLYDKLKGN